MTDDIKLEFNDDSKVSGENALRTLLKEKAVPFEELRRRGFGALMDIVKVLIGVIPNCDVYLEIWPPAFRCYNLMVPNFFNIPATTLGLSPSKQLSLAMYRSSRGSGCSYCSAHTCSFALRRGVVRETIMQSTSPENCNLLPDDEIAVVKVASGLGKVPCTTTQADIDDMKSFYSDADSELIACGAIGMGFLNKVMDAISVELEVETYAQVKDAMGAEEDGSAWETGKAGVTVKQTDMSKVKEKEPTQDGFFAKLAHLRFLPSALWMERKWTKDYSIPNSWPATGQFLRRWTGYDWPVFSQIINPRVIFSLSAMLRENFDPDQSATGLPAKGAIGIIFARVIKNPDLEKVIKECSKLGTTQDDMDRAAAFADGPNTVDKSVSPLWMAAKGISYSPCQVSREIVSALRADKSVTPEQIVELVCWVATLQLVHRLMCYYRPPYNLNEVRSSSCF